MFVHSTGHGLKIDMKMLFDMIEPKNVMPIHGWLTLRYFNAKNFLGWGMKENDIYLTEDGQFWEFDGKTWSRGEKIDAKPILIDGLGIGDISDIVIKDRQQLAEYGYLTAIFNLSKANHRLMGRVHIYSRGFIYMKKSEELLKEIDSLVKDVHMAWLEQSATSNKYDESLLKERVEKALGRFLFKKTERKPVIQAVII
jgi:ribonuclease J